MGSAKANLKFPVGRIYAYLRKGRYGKRIGGLAPVFLAAVLEYFTTEVLELAGDAARENRKSRISPRHIQLAVGYDKELSKVFANAILAEGGVTPNMHPDLIPKKNAKK